MNAVFKVSIVLLLFCLLSLYISTSSFAQTPNTTTDIASLRQEAEKGSAEAQDKLGALLLFDPANFLHHREAIKWFQKAADQGYAKSQFRLGRAHEMGQLGVNQDYKEAVKWYQKSAEQGIPQAQESLGEMYYFGKGVNQDYKMAAEWFEKSAEQGYPIAQNNLASMFEDGQGVPQDINEAIKWFQKAADQGFDQAKQSLTELRAKQEKR